MLTFLIGELVAIASSAKFCVHVRLVHVSCTFSARPGRSQHLLCTLDLHRTYTVVTNIKGIMRS